MSDLVGNPEDRFSRVEAHMVIPNTLCSRMNHPCTCVSVMCHEKSAFLHMCINKSAWSASC